MNRLTDTAALILAGGKGTRMESNIPKVLHEICGKPMIFYTIDNLQKIGILDLYVILSYKATEVKAKIKKYCNCKFTYQHKPYGTGHAIYCSIPLIDSYKKHLFIVNGDDSAFYSKDTLINFLDSHIKTRAMVSVITLKLTGENQYGKIFRGKDGRFINLLEDDKYRKSKAKSEEINCGAYIFDKRWLADHVDLIEPNTKDEYNLTELLNIAGKKGTIVNLFSLKDRDEWVGINTLKELEYANKLMEKKLNDRG